MIAADNAGDLDAIAAAYAEDATLYPPEGEPVHGRAAIRERYAEGFSKFALEVSIEFDPRGMCYAPGTRPPEGVVYRMGRTRGRFVWRDESEPTEFEDLFMMSVKPNSDGVWKIASLKWWPAGR